MAYNNKNRIKQAQNTKQRIYESAEKLFLIKDVDKVTVDEIVKEAGVAKGSFYVYYSSKDELITSMLFDKTNSVDNDYNQFLNNLPLDLSVEEMLIQFLSMIADELVNVIGYDKMKVVYRIQISTVIQNNTLMNYNRSLYKMIANLIEKGIVNKEFKTKFSPETIAKQFLVSYRGLTYEWCVRYPDFDLKKQVIEHYSLMIEGLKIK